jgi:hypothetical protein
MTEALQKAEQENKRLKDIVCHMASGYVQILDAFLEENEEDAGMDQPWPYRVARDMMREINAKYDLIHFVGSTWMALTADEKRVFLEGRLKSNQFFPEEKAKIVEHFLAS